MRIDRAAAEEASMKIFLSSDMEGTAGVVDWEQCIGDGPQAVAGRRLLSHTYNPRAVAEVRLSGTVTGEATRPSTVAAGRSP
jgi:D-aminopeptidase